MTRGVMLMAWGKRGYGFMAHSLAVSIKHHSPDLAIHLIASRSAMKEAADVSMFDSIQWLDENPIDPGRFKANIYELTPFDLTLYLDVDALCLAPLEPLFDKLEASGVHYATFINEVYDINAPNILPQMYWAYRTDIWQHYGFDEQTKFPATQSSIQFIRKCDKAAELYDLFKAAFDNPIPLDRLRNKWGGGQPDELYLNVAMAQQGEINHIGSGVIYFGNDATKRPHQVASDYFLLSYFGNRGNVKQQFWDYYDKQLHTYQAKRGGRHIFKSHLVKSDKIANIASTQRTQVKPTYTVKPGAVQMPKQAGKVALFTSYYEPTNPPRVREIRRCLELNIQCASIDVIYNLGTPYVNDKIINLPYDRPTYQDFLNEAAKVEADYYIIANADIFFTSEIEAIKDLTFDNRVLCLSRWDVMASGMARLFNYEWSQDTWVFKGKPPRIANVDFPLGVPACDNRFAYELAQSGMVPVNPAVIVKSYHVHTSNSRTYKERDRLKGPTVPVMVTDGAGYKRRSVLIVQPGKVGDIVCVMPIAKHYHDNGWKVYWSAPKQYHAMLSYANYITPVANELGSYDKVIDLAFGINPRSKHHKEWLIRRNQPDSFVAFKFEIAGVDMVNARLLTYSRNHAAEAALYNYLQCDSVNPYIVVHRSSTYGGAIDIHSVHRVIEFAPIDSFTIFDWRKVLEGAAEIHCIDSSLANFVDCLELTASLHYYPNDKVPMLADRTILTKPWQVYEMAQL